MTGKIEIKIDRKGPPRVEGTDSLYSAIMRVSDKEEQAGSREMEV